MKIINENIKEGTKTVVDATAEEIAEANQMEILVAQERQKRADEITAKATAKASGNTKLLDLGLTQAEATALTGYTPPSED